MAPALMRRANPGPLIVHVEEMILPAVVNQAGRVVQIPLNWRVVKLRAKRLVVVLLPGDFFRREIHVFRTRARRLGRNGGEGAGRRQELAPTCAQLPSRK